MTVSAVSHYRGGTIDVVAPLAKTLKAVYLKYGVAYRLSRFETGPNVVCQGRTFTQRETPQIPRLPFTARGFSLPRLLLNFYALAT